MYIYECFRQQNSIQESYLYTTFAYFHFTEGILYKVVFVSDPRDPHVNTNTTVYDFPFDRKKI